MKSRQHSDDIYEKQKTAFIASVERRGFRQSRQCLHPAKLRATAFISFTNTSQASL